MVLITSLFLKMLAAKSEKCVWEALTEAQTVYHLTEKPKEHA